MRLSLLLPALAAVPALAQAPTARQDESPFRRLDLPTPSLIRTGAGTPGPAYWQQRAEYVIKATLDTAAKAVIGDERISYTNNSPDTLRYLWLQLDQNLFAAGSRGSALDAAGIGTDGGIRLVWVGEPAVVAAKGRAARPAAPLVYSVNGTMMRVDLARPLPPKGRQLLSISWTFPFGPNRNRMGLETIDGSTIFEVAQWYPRLAVYDDVRGWNTEQYLGWGEFYLEYGSFDVSLTVPANMLVAATGTLRNPSRSSPRPSAPASPRPVGASARSRSGARARWTTRPRAQRRRAARSPGGSQPTACATSPGRRRGTSSGTRSALTAARFW